MEKSLIQVKARIKEITLLFWLHGFQELIGGFLLASEDRGVWERLKIVRIWAWLGENTHGKLGEITEGNPKNKAVFPTSLFLQFRGHLFRKQPTRAIGKSQEALQLLDANVGLKTFQNLKIDNTNVFGSGCSGKGGQGRRRRGETSVAEWRFNFFEKSCLPLDPFFEFLDGGRGFRKRLHVFWNFNKMWQKTRTARAVEKRVNFLRDSKKRSLFPNHERAETCQ